MAELAVVGLNIGAQLWAGKEREKLKTAEAQGYRDAAQRRMAVATREASEEVRKKEFVYSRALAVMGAQGASMADPGIQALMSDLYAEGEYRVMSVLWAGQNDAEALRYRADVAMREGDAAVDASRIGAVTSAVSTYASFGGFQRDPTTGKLPNPLDVLGLKSSGAEAARWRAKPATPATPTSPGSPGTGGGLWGPGTPYATEEEYNRALDEWLRRNYPGTQIPYR